MMIRRTDSFSYYYSIIIIHNHFYEDTCRYHKEDMSPSGFFSYVYVLWYQIIIIHNRNVCRDSHKTLFYLERQ